MTTETSPQAGMLTSAQRERLLLAPYAMFSCQSAGRHYPEPPHPYRSPYQRDRDRILHSSAYRRLSGKMQVFTGQMGDYHRTRLTHTQEVATIARTLARALCLNEDLVEALALIHDIGHPPFGHAGEDALNQCLLNEGGFSHNQFALTIAEELEMRYTRFPGLNLTREVLDGQVARVDKSGQPRPRLLEVQLVDASDSTTYDAHDTDDAVKLGLVTIDQLQQVALVRQCVASLGDDYSALNEKQLRKAIVHQLIERQVSDLLAYCSEQLRSRGFASSGEAADSDFVIQPSPAMREQKAELEQFLYQRVYRHPKLIAVRQQAQSRLVEMFRQFVRCPETMPEKYCRRAQSQGVPRAAVEFIAGMTDHYCDRTYRRLADVP